MPQTNNSQSKRKAGQAVTRGDVGKAMLIGGGVGAAVTGVVELMKYLSPKEQNQMMDEALVAQAEDGADASAYGIPAASVIAAGVVLEEMNRDIERREMQALADVVVDVDGLPINNIRRM